jgi:myo-inositol 2-dehydrogenase / D-chiro-inositol 1-dehydrogenase
MKKHKNPSIRSLTRRDFVKASSLTAGGLLLGSLPVSSSAYVGGSDFIKVALIGCGDRGTGAAFQSLNADPGVRLVAMADILEDRLTESFDRLQERFGDTGQLDVPEEHKFIGFNGYKEAIALADVVLLTTPTFFRPLHFEEAVRRGKHVFMEKPVAVDPAGVRRVLAAGERAKDQRLNVVVGLQRRYQNSYREMYRRLQNGEIGEIITAQVYWNQGPFYYRERRPEWSELEHQIRNHFHFIWQAGDQVLDQLIHNIDVANWFIGDFPVTAQGMGGREVRTGKEYGQIFDHNFVEYTYPNGVVVSAQCRQIPGCWNRVAENFQGTNGSVFTDGSSTGILRNRGGDIRFRYDGMEDPSPYQQEHDELYAALRSGNVIDNTEYGAKSSMASIMGFMATYSGQFLEWDQALNSDKRMYPHHDLKPEDVDWNTPAPVQPLEDGYYPVPVPGQTGVL